MSLEEYIEGLKRIHIDFSAKIKAVDNRDELSDKGKKSEVEKLNTELEKAVANYENKVDTDVKNQKAELISKIRNIYLDSEQQQIRQSCIGNVLSRLTLYFNSGMPSQAILEQVRAMYDAGCGYEKEAVVESLGVYLFKYQNEEDYPLLQDFADSIQFDFVNHFRDTASRVALDEARDIEREYLRINAYRKNQGGY